MRNQAVAEGIPSRGDSAVGKQQIPRDESKHTNVYGQTDLHSCSNLEKYQGDRTRRRLLVHSVGKRCHRKYVRGDRRHARTNEAKRAIRFGSDGGRGNLMLTQMKLER